MSIKKVINAIKEFCECKDCKDDECLTTMNNCTDECNQDTEHKKEECDCKECQ